MPDGIYSIERDIVDPVFFAVVPDAFMAREAAGRPVSLYCRDGADWSSEHERPLISPHDRWSF